MGNNDKRPKIRFKGFNDDWEQHKLENVFKEYSEKNHEELPALTIIQGEGTIERDKSDRNLSYDKSNLSNYKLVNRGDFIVHLRSFEGGLEIAKNTGIISPAYHTFHGENTDSVFYYSYFRSKKFIDIDLKPHVYGIRDGRSIDIEGMKTIKIPYTKYDEQKKIGEYISTLNTLISLHQRKLEKLGNIKKSMLEKMFPKDENKVPEIRFKGFNDDWEQHKVRDIADRFDNLRVPVAANLRISGTTPYYGANGIQDYVEGFTHDGEFVLVAEDGANDLKNYPVKCVKGRIWVNNHAHVLQGKPNIADNQFLAFSINRADIESLLVGGGRAKLNAETMMDIFLMIPSIDEQRVIGQYISTVDHLINLHQRKLEKLKNIKKACLEKMFV